MVLVAAIAAGVLINTAGLLQSQAEATGEESSAQVVDRVQVSSVTGSAIVQDDPDSTDDETGEEISLIELTVLRSPGADDIDLTNAIIEVFANGESDTLTSVAEDGDGVIPDDQDIREGDSDTGDFTENQESTFGIQDIQNADDGALSDTSERAKLFFFLDNIDGNADGTDSDARLSTGDTVSITVTTASGGTAFVEKRAPSSLEEGDTYRL